MGNIRHTKDCKRFFLRFDPDCPKCAGIKSGELKRTTRDLYAIRMRKRREEKNLA